MSSPAIDGAGLRQVGPHVRPVSFVLAYIRSRSKAQLGWALELSALALMVFGGLALRFALCLTQSVN
jgi:hypothetical protein